MKNYGFDPNSVVITPDQYSLAGGQLTGAILREDGQWDDFLPEFEGQTDPSFETSNCTAFASTSQIETLFNFLKEKKNYSDRFVGIKAGTTQAGNNPHAVYEAIRKEGLINEEFLPFDRDLLETVDEYYSFKGADEKKCEIEGQKWVSQYDFKHDWVLTGQSVPQDYRILTLKEALKYSPLSISVTAWILEDEVYVDRGVPNNHLTLLYGFNDKGFKVFDSYDHSKKILSYDHNIMFAKRIVLKKKEKSKKNWLVDLFKSVVQFMQDIIKIK